jgi:hypothetical protein
MKWDRRWLSLVLVLAAGCGYETYKNRLEDSIAEEDYNEKVNRLLGPTVGDPARGIEIRLPKQAAASPLADADAPKGTTLVFPADAEAKIPLQVIVFITRKTKETDLLPMGEFAQHVLQSAADWMGAGVEPLPAELKLESENIPTGPAYLHRDRLKPFPVQRVVVKQVVAGQPAQPTGAATKQAEAPGVEHVWRLYFTEQPEGEVKVRAMVGYRIPAAEDRGDVDDSIRLSITTARLQESTEKAETRDTEPTEEPATPAKKAATKRRS